MIADKITQLRLAANWSQQELATRLHISSKAVKNWEVGISEPFAKHIRQLAEVFNVSTDFLLEVDASDIINISNMSSRNKQLLRTIAMLLAESGEDGALT